MARISSMTISRGGEFELEQTNDTPPKAAAKNGDSGYTQAQPDKISYSGVGDCVLRVAKRFGMTFDINDREKCEGPSELVWEDASTHVAAAKEIVVMLLNNHQKAIKGMRGIAVHQFNGGEMHGTVRVSYTTNKNGNIIALDLKSDKSGFKAHVEDSSMFAYLWGHKISVASK